MWNSRTAKLMGLVVMAAVVSGCAAKEIKPHYSNGSYQSDPKLSYALNVLRAAGAKEIRDIPKAQLLGSGSLNQSNDLAYAAVGSTAAYLGNLRPLGLSSLARAGITFAILAPSEVAPEASSGILAWMPADLAATGEEAREELNRMIISKLREVLKETPFPEGYAPELGAEGNFIPVVGRQCSSGEARCGYSIGGILPARKVKGPDFVTSEKVWAFTFRGSFTLLRKSYDSLKIFEPDLPIFPDLDVYVRLSKRLPDWIYIYLAPYSEKSSSKFGMMVEEKSLYMRQAAVINRGHLFLLHEP